MNESSYKPGQRVYSIRPSGNVPMGVWGTIKDPLDDGRISVHWDNIPGGHTYAEPEAFMRHGRTKNDPREVAISKHSEEVKRLEEHLSGLHAAKRILEDTARIIESLSLSEKGKLARFEQAKKSDEYWLARYRQEQKDKAKEVA